MISASAVAMRHELIMSLVAGLNPIMKVWKRAPQLNNDLKSVPVMARIFSYSGRCTEISLEFTDKQGFLSRLSVSKTHFTDKPSFSGDLSVNFWPL